MKNPKSIIVLLYMVFLSSFQLIAQSDQPVQIGNRRELFVDRYLLDKMNNVSQRMHHPVNEGAVLNFDKPWEGNFSGYCTIIKDGNLYRMYYRGIREAGRDGNDNEVTCYAESKDGVNWTKPSLGIYTIDGTSANNVILAHAAPATHNFSPFLDTNPEVKKGERYKAVGGTDRSGLLAYISEDGIHWKKKQEKAVFQTGVFDSQNVVFWSAREGQYVCYFRTWS
ncbi:MAG: hypothetical protein EAS52_23030, partial [Parapedobacter sp.]